jgi:hypothetical protein
LQNTNSLEEYYKNAVSKEASADIGIPDAFIGVGYSSKAILAVLIVACVMVIFPIALGFRKLPGPMIIVGSNSLAISAACHVYSGRSTDFTKNKSSRSKATDNIDMELTERSGVALEQQPLTDDSICRYLIEMTRKKLKWGVVSDSGVADGPQGVQINAGHLGFGSIEDNVQQPEDGEMYW